ncbi:thioredoxin family protein [bacterium]|nr:thioredoxin family protein [bacterium]
MKQWILIFSVCLISFTACKKDLVDTSTNEVEDVNGEQSFDEKIAEGTSMVFFHASWCSKCAAQRPAFESVSKNAELAFAEFYEVEHEDNKEITEKYDIPGFPIIVIFVDGEEKERFTGEGHSEEELTNALKMYQ